MAASMPLPSAGHPWRDVVCPDCGRRLIRLSAPAIPVSPEVLGRANAVFAAAQLDHGRHCRGVVLVAVDVTGEPSTWRPVTEGDLERLSFHLYGAS